MNTNIKLLISIAITLSVVFLGYLANNNWQIVPGVFITYGGISYKEYPNDDTAKAAMQYSTYCAGCHGQQMATYVNHTWKIGKTKSGIFKAIKYGYPNDGMPGFEPTFSDREIHDLSSYLLTGINIAQTQPLKTKTPQSGLFATQLLTIKTDTITSDIKMPWCIAFLPGGELLVTDRDGKLYKVKKGNPLQEISGVPKVVAKGQGGLFDVLPHPDFKNNHQLYLSYSKPESAGSNKSTTAIMLATLNGNMLQNQQDIFVAKPYSTTHHHYGGKMVFGKDGCLYFSVGERGNEKGNPQNIGNDLGKIHRIKADGTIPSDNPFVGISNAKSSIYCYGNRNPQGLALNPHTGAIWENEHGPMGGDEINIIEKGKNYGWPVITYGVNYNGTSITDKTDMPGMEQPIHFWVPSIATSGLAFVDGTNYKGWEGDVLSGSLKFNWVSRCHTEGDAILTEESMLAGIGRLRDIRTSPDGYIFVAVENPGYVFKLLPVANKIDINK